MGIMAAGATDVGRKRQSNQDSIHLSQKMYFYMVADGMGGHSGGDIASKMATTLVPEYLLNHLSTVHSEPEAAKVSIDAVKHANNEILKYSQANHQVKGMGTTLVSLLFYQSTLFITNVGDSRAYMVHQGELYQLSRDHSLIQEKINLGLYTREEGMRDKMKNVLSRTVGFEKDVEVDLFHFKVHRGDIFLLCSDGLHGKVADQDIVHLVNQFLPREKTPTQTEVQGLAQALIDLANHNGGQDNISVVIVSAV